MLYILQQRYTLFKIRLTEVHMKNIAYAGSFDIFTNGHLWVVKAGLEIAEHVTIFVADNTSKKYLFSKEQRITIIENIIQDEGLKDRVRVIGSTNEYVALRIAEYNITHMIRGIRNSVDFDQEKLIQRANYSMFGGVQTIFVMPPSELESVSSSFVKALIGPAYWTTYVQNLIPQASLTSLIKKRIIDMIIETFSEHHIIDENTTSILKNDYLNDISKNKFMDFILFVFDCYSMNRHYHNLVHILNMMEQSQKECKNNIALIVAIFLHDLIQKDNNSYNLEYSKYGITPIEWNGCSCEKRSALFATYFAKVANLDSHLVKEIENLIKTTEHFSQQSKRKLTYEQNLILKIDFDILGSPKNVYDEYAQNIRKEYQEYNDIDYNNGRKEVLKSLMNTIEKASYFSETFKTNACKNILNEMSNLT